MNPLLIIKTVLLLSIGVGHACRLVDNCEPSPPPPPEPSPCPPPPEPSPCPPPPEPSPCPPPPEPSPSPPPPEPSPCPPSPEPSPCPPSPSPPSPPPCPCPTSCVETDVIRSSSSTIDTSFYQSAFSIASISETECQLYIQYLSQLPNTEISALNEIVSCYSSNTFTLAESITDFIPFRNEMNSIYDLFNSQSLYVANADWTTQTTIYEEAKVHFTNALGYCVPGCSLYNLINFACTDVTYMPLIVGSCHYLVDLQNQFYSASSAGSSYYQESSSSHQASSSSYQAASSTSSTVIAN